MIDFKLTYHRYSECTILVEWPKRIGQDVLKDVLLYKNHLKKSGIKSIIEVNSAYNSILIFYRDTIDNVNDAFYELKQHYGHRKANLNSMNRLWKIPVCYDADFGWDLEEMSIAKKMTVDAIIAIHTDTIYTVFFIGFLPGFLYLGGLDARLEFPRKKSPRQHIEKGAVAIGGNQTGVYPNKSPAGWNIIGNCPLELFDVTNPDPCFARAGDRIQFYKVDLKEYREITDQVSAGVYQITNEYLNG